MTFVKTVFWWILALMVGIAVSVLVPTIANANPMKATCQYQSEYFDLVIKDKYVRQVSKETSLGESVNIAIKVGLPDNILGMTIAITNFVYENDFTAEEAKRMSKLIYNDCIKGYN